LNIENVKGPDDWEWYYGTLSKSELLDIVKKRETREEETQMESRTKEAHAAETQQAEQNPVW
jgi:hypothetical protein